MITLFKGENLQAYGFEDLFTATKIEAGFLSYGNKYPFFTIWEQKCEDNITAILCKYENTFFIVVNENANINEIKEFIFAVGFISIQAHPTVAEKLKLLAFKEYIVLSKKGDGESMPFVPPSVQKIYDILYDKTSSNIKHFDYPQFYADLSHRLRHNTAAAVIVDDSAVALASHITKDFAVLSGVSTLSSKRLMGYGSKVLENIRKLLGSRMIFVATTPETSRFYIKNGFEEFSSIAIYETEEL